MNGFGLCEEEEERKQRREWESESGGEWRRVDGMERRARCVREREERESEE